MTERNEFKAEGIMENGYGLIAKKVMKDKELSIEAKAIYSYLASYAGAGNTAYPSVSLMCGDLNIGEERFYRHRKKLVQKGYLVIKKHRNEKGWIRNVYQLPLIPTPQNPSMDDPSMDDPSMDGRGTNSNSSISNSSNSNSNNTTTHNIEADASPTFSLYHLEELNKITQDTKISGIIYYYAQAYKVFFEKNHPRLKQEQLLKVAETLSDVDSEYELSLLDGWGDVIGVYFEEWGIGDGNINRFASGDSHQGVLAGMLK